jgi:hypothetical protein
VETKVVMGWFSRRGVWNLCMRRWKGGDNNRHLGLGRSDYEVEVWNLGAAPNYGSHTGLRPANKLG